MGDIREKTAIRSTFIQHLKETLKTPLRYSRQLLPFVTKIEDLQAEIDLLTAYSSDTIYRLSYETMSYDYISPAINQLLGYTTHEMERINFRSLILETKMINNGIMSVRSFSEFEKIRRLGKVYKWQADYLMKRKDGRQIWVSDISYPWYDEEGNIIGSVGCLRDITERIQAEEHMQEQLVRMAHIDPLTSLANRRAFFEKVGEELKRINRTQSHCSILLLDLDHFKRINDTYGHDAGDKILAEVAQIIRSCLRETDVPARIGGEEFGVFLPDTPSQGAYFVADRLCKRIADHAFDVGAGDSVRCTVSIGFSCSDMLEERDATKLYKLADTRLYIAKNTGRNQVSADEIVYAH